MGQSVKLTSTWLSHFLEWRVYTLLNSLFLRVKGGVGLQVKKA